MWKRWMRSDKRPSKWLITEDRETVRKILTENLEMRQFFVEMASRIFTDEEKLQRLTLKRFTNTKRNANHTQIKTILICFCFNQKSVVHIQFIKKGHVVNQYWYWNILAFPKSQNFNKKDSYFFVSNIQTCVAKIPKSVP